jgi:hypothetical protein
VIYITTIGILGGLGSGKTCMLTRYAILTKKLHPNKKIVSNYHLHNYKYSLLDMMDLYLNQKDIDDMIILGDEFYTSMDCRVSSSYRNRIESYFIAMTRKKKADFFFTCQYEKFMDCRLAPFVKIRLVMEGIPILKKTVLDGVEYKYTVYHPYIFRCTLFDDRNIANPTKNTFMFDGRRWFKEYNTEQVIYPPDDYIDKVKVHERKRKLKKEKEE